MTVLDVVVVAVVALVALLAFSYALRRRAITRVVGFVPCMLREGEGEWARGICRFDVATLAFHSRRALRLRPSRVVRREQIVALTREDAPASAEIPFGDEVVRVVLTLAGGGTVEMLMSRRAGNALGAWAEAAPPSYLKDFYS